MRTDTTQDERMSVGAGLAIAGVWLAASAMSIIIMMIMFVWSAPSGETVVSEKGGGLFFIVVLIIAAPLFAAYSVTKMVINNEAD